MHTHSACGCFMTVRSLKATVSCRGLGRGGLFGVLAPVGLQRARVADTFVIHSTIINCALLSELLCLYIYPSFKMVSAL